MAGISSKASGALTNKYKFNGKELQSSEFNDGSGLDAYDFSARVYDHQAPHFWQLDPLADKTPNWSPYVAMGDNPIRHIDPTGKKYINFDANGNYINTTKDNWWNNFWSGGARGRILDKSGDVQQKFSFADQKSDVADIQNGIIKKIEFVKESDIMKMVSAGGGFDRDNKTSNRSLKDRYSYILKEGVGGGRMDFSFTAIPKMYAGASKKPLTEPSSIIFLVDGVAHNHMNFGNLLYGATGDAMGFTSEELLGGAHYNSRFPKDKDGNIYRGNGSDNSNNYPPQWDSSDDQESIYLGIKHSDANGYGRKVYTAIPGPIQ